MKSTKPIYTIGHRNPDTDSICSAIGYAHLKQAMGENVVAARAGKINAETKYALEHFQVEQPLLLTDLYPRVKDITIDCKIVVKQHDTLRLYVAVDDVDGDVSARVTVEKRGDSLFYTVSDTAGNRSETVREIPYSIGEPKLRLLGGETLVIDTGFLFEDPGFTCRDARGNDLSALVSREGEVIPYQPGDYVLRYRIENALGERVEAKRTVTVKPLQNPDPIDPAGKLIYLTFDDGPGPYTDRLLDILSQYNVKATFFVTGLYPDYADCIGRAFREGHSIGVHSACHNYRRIYASEEAFFDDFSAVQDLIYTQTGQYTSLCRFPGGSSNTVSRFNRGIMSRLTKSMEELGYHYYDWNVSSGDAGETTNTERVFENIVNGCSNQRVSVVLQHDSKEFSVAAVERVIVWGLTNGYQFVPLDESSAEIHHRIAN